MSIMTENWVIEDGPALSCQEGGTRDFKESWCGLVDNCVSHSLDPHQWHFLAIKLGILGLLAGPHVLQWSLERIQAFLGLNMRVLIN